MAKEAPSQRSKDIVDRGTIEHEQAPHTVAYGHTNGVKLAHRAPICRADLNEHTSGES